MTWRRLVFLWQYSATPGRPTEIARRVRSYGFDALAVKAFDGTSWMGRFDSSPWAIHDLTTLVARATECRGEGVRLVPWCVPQGTLDRQAEVALAAEVASEFGELIIDAEPYRGFWESSWESFADYLAWLRQAAPDAIIHVTFDAPYRDYSRIRINDWAHLVNGYLMPQDYWTDFQEPPAHVLRRSHAQLKGLGEICHVLPLNGSVAEYAAVGAETLDMDLPRLAFWALHNTNDVALQARGLIPLSEPSSTNDTATAPSSSEGQADEATPQQEKKTVIDENTARSFMETLRLWYRTQAPARDEILHLRDAHKSQGAAAVASASKYPLLVLNELERLLGEPITGG